MKAYGDQELVEQKQYDDTDIFQICMMIYFKHMNDSINVKYSSKVKMDMYIVFIFCLFWSTFTSLYDQFECFFHNLYDRKSYRFETAQGGNKW